MEYLKRTASNANPTDCIEWPYSRDNEYGKVNYKGKSQLVHRVSFELFVRPLADDECALHKCDNRPCFNPLHLFGGSYEDNAKDRDQKGRGANGLRIGKGKLTPEQVNQIRIRWVPRKRGVVRDLAKEFGIRRSYVCEIAKGIHQKHVGWPQGISPDDPDRKARKNKGPV